VYRGPSTSYNYNYAGELHANKGGFAPLNYDDFGGGCDIPPPCPTTTGDPLNPQPGDILRGSSFCTYKSITWYNTGSSTPIGFGDTYTIQESDYFYKIYYVVEYPNGSTASSDISCLNTVTIPGYGTYWISEIGGSWQTDPFLGLNPTVAVDKYGNSYVGWQQTPQPGQETQDYWLFIRKLNNRGEEIWTKRYGKAGAAPTRNQRISIVLDPSNENLFVGHGAFFRQPDAPSSLLPRPSVELYKINSSTGELCWYYFHIFFPASFSSLNADSFLRLQWDNGRLVILHRGNVWTAYCYSLGPTSNPATVPYFSDIDPTVTYPGGLFAESGTTLSTRAIADAMVIRSQTDPSKTYVISIDTSNRYIWWETNTDYQSTVGASGLRYGPSSNFLYANPPRMEPVSVTYSGQEHFVTANGELTGGAGTLVVWDQNRQPVLKTDLTFGVPVAAKVNPKDSKSLYIACMSPSTVGISGLPYQNNAILGVFEYTPETNSIKSYSAVAVIPNWRPRTNVGDQTSPLFGGPGGLNADIDNVNRVVLTFIDGNQANQVTTSGVNSLFIVGASIQASGTSKILNWNNEKPFNDQNVQGLIVSTDSISQNAGSDPLPTLVTPFTNAGSVTPYPYVIGSGLIPSGDVLPNAGVIDYTGVFANSYGIASFD
jgi:hypothetical protein